MRRRGVLAAGAAVLARAAAAQEPRERISGQELPILFIHGNGDTAALWMSTIWRFESNFYPRARLFALDMRLPAARRDDRVREAGRSSAEEATAQLAQEIQRVRRVAGAERIVLVAHSRAGNLVRNYLRLSGDQKVRAAVLCGTPSHGVIVSQKHLVGSEFNGASAFLRTLNTTPGEVPTGVPIFTLASDRMDRWAQPDGRFLGLPGVPTGIDFRSPALRGATNVVLPGADQLELAYSAEAFAEIHRIATGELPQTVRVRPEVKPTLSGKVSGFEAGVPTNIGVSGARLRIYGVEPATGRRVSGELLDHLTPGDGSWGPFDGDSEHFYEFELTMRGYPVTHIYRPPFLRGSEYVNLRPYLPAAGDPKQGGLVVVTRAHGFFDIGRDPIEIGGQAVRGEPDVPHENTLRAIAPESPQASMSVLHVTERLSGLTWPLSQGHVTVIELGE